MQWSPEQIAGWLRRNYPGDENYQVSHQTIYRSLFIQARDALRKELLGICGAHEQCAVRVITHGKQTITAESRTRCRSASVRPRLKIGRYQVTGR